MPDAQEAAPAAAPPLRSPSDRLYRETSCGPAPKRQRHQRVQKVGPRHARCSGPVLLRRDVGTDQCQCFGYAPARQYYPSSCKPALACVWSTLCWGWKVLVPTCEGLFVSQCDIGTDQCMSVFWSCGGLPRLSDQWQTSVGMCSVNVLSGHQILAAMCNGLFVSQLQCWYGPMPVLRLRSGSPHYLTSGKAALSCVQMTLCWGAAHLLQHGKAR